MFKCFYSILKIYNFRNIVHFLKRILQVVDNAVFWQQPRPFYIGTPLPPGVSHTSSRSEKGPAVVTSSGAPVTFYIAFKVYKMESNLRHKLIGHFVLVGYSRNKKR